MSKFIAYVKQRGEGCDYTIGCGLAIYEPKATTLDEATAEVLREYPPVNHEGKRDIASIMLYEVAVTYNLSEAIDVEIERLSVERKAEALAEKKRKLEALRREVEDG